MIIACVFWCALESMDIAYINAYVCMRSHGAALARVFHHRCRATESHGAHVHVHGACAWGTSICMLMDKGACAGGVCEG